MPLSNCIARIKERRQWWKRESETSVATGPRDIYKGAGFAFEECLTILESELEADRQKVTAAPQVPAKLDSAKLFSAILRALGRFRHGRPSEARSILEKVVQG